MEELKQLKHKLATERPVSWTEFPDISLYKDQVVSYMYRQLIDFDGDGQLTSAMVSNYVKDKLLPRADGKKYTREHLAGLTEICLLKQVLSVRNIGLLLQQEQEGNDPEGFYSKFKQLLDEALTKMAEQIDPNWEAEALSDKALQLAVSSYCDKLVCERLLEIAGNKMVAEVHKKPDKTPDKSRGK